MRNYIIIVTLFISLLSGCVVASPDSQTSLPEKTVDQAPVEQPAPSPSPKKEGKGLPINAPIPIDNPRYVDDGVNVKDIITGNVWYGSDECGLYDNFNAASMCATMGMRVATSAEVIALGAPLPSAFKVYSWADPKNLSFFPDNARPIVTSDGCVDIKTGTQFVGDCVIPSTATEFVPKISRSTMCLK